MMDSDFQDLRILVVDDDKTLADLLAEFIKKLGYFVEVVYDPIEALALFEKSHFPLVITDLMLPGMNGIELLKEINRLNKRTMVLVITGYATIESAVSAIKNGAYDYIQKPFKFQELEVIINRCRDRYGLMKQLGFFRGLNWAHFIAIPFWLILGIIVGLIWK